MTGVRTTCAYCGVGCGVIATPQPDGSVDIKGDPNHPANYGRLCAKGTNLGETLSTEDRLLHPMINGVQSDWDSATSLMAEKFQTAIREHGPDSVAFYVSGQLLTEDYYVANKLMKGFIGSANIDTNSRLCMASSVVGHKRAFGTDTVPCTYEDLENADLIVLVGSNLAWCHPVLHQRILAAKETRGTQIINIDPRRTATSDLADMHLGIKSGGDVALFNGLLNAIVDAGAIDQDYIDQHVNGFDAAISTARETSLDQLMNLTGLSGDELTAFYSAWIENKRVVTIYSQGVNQARDGSDKVNAIINCHLATGRIGRIGMGPFSITGQPNAMGGREVGGLSNMLAAHLDIENENHREIVADFWNAPTLPTQAGLKAVDLFDGCASGQIKALWIICTNPAVSMPRANDVAAAIKNVDFVAVSDIIAKTDTTVLADVLLPATGWGEKDGTVTNSERRISRQRGFLPAPADTKHDWQIICDVAAKMGWGNAFAFKTPSDIFSEWAAMTKLSRDAGKDLDLTSYAMINDVEYDAMEPIQWPIKSDQSDTRFFANGGFYTSDARANMLAVAPQSNASVTSIEYPFTLNTGRVRDHWHTMTRSAKSPTLSTHMGEPYAEIHPDDARALNIKPASLVMTESPHGSVILRALITDRVQRGQIFAPLHWTSLWASRARIDTLVPSLCDPHSGQPELKRAAVKISPYAAHWYAFAVSADEPHPTTPYWAKAQTKSGWRVELAAKGAPLDFITFAKSELGLSDEEPVVYEDKNTGQYRAAFMRDGRVVATIFAANEPVALSRTFVVNAMNTGADHNLLAGIGGADQPDQGAIVCTCFNVGANKLATLVQSGKAISIAQIGDAVLAGTNCGSCRPELAAIIHRHAPKIAAE
ncbi:nitrate reductase [Amylibacter ulvae]|uniref:Nitrate reductase n=1 Tax=Paramylibacter ulvae TaxID=1651968 RepID=A0ABQ3CUA2_9RHOB|nr:nitrate reductase [Amylibacter ulvae]GHA43529.1 nitrate reductase [Amylibacter ulvae]